MVTKSIINKEGIDLCVENLDYDTPEQTKVNAGVKRTFLDMINDLEVKISEPRYSLYFTHDKEARNVYRVYMKRKSTGQKISFTFGQSIYNTQREVDPTLYDILTGIDINYFAEDDFREFCSEFGYDECDREDQKLHRKVLEEKAKLRKIFRDYEVEIMPR